MTVSLEFILGTVFAVVCGVVGYFIRRQDGEICSIKVELAGVSKEIHETRNEIHNELTDTRHNLRGEINKIVLTEETRRTAAINNLEPRFNTQVSRVIDLINERHTDLKGDLKDISDRLREK